ncbi:hypothetical protein [Halorussus halobius]|uniref:hypothetical protein n=1 Tax=Halorussus halobius TaxID=1710537 RepID=UPI001092CE0B|nr:hypothetical protein [Halorussus halobius]
MATSETDSEFVPVADADDPERARTHLVATARYVSAHVPTRRSAEQTFTIASRLRRGEAVHEAD